MFKQIVTMMRVLFPILNHVSWNHPWTFKLREPIRIQIRRPYESYIKARILLIHFGPGAGYIMGRTLFVTMGCPLFVAGFTRNANIIPPTADSPWSHSWLRWRDSLRHMGSSRRTIVVHDFAGYCTHG